MANIENSISYLLFGRDLTHKSFILLLKQHCENTFIQCSFTLQKSDMYTNVQRIVPRFELVSFPEMFLFFTVPISCLLRVCVCARACTSVQWITDSYSIWKFPETVWQTHLQSVYTHHISMHTTCVANIVKKYVAFERVFSLNLHSVLTSGTLIYFALMSVFFSCTRYFLAMACLSHVLSL